MENHKVVLKECNVQRQSETEVWTDKFSESRVFSSFEIPWDTDFYEDFIEKTMDFIKSFHNENTQLDENDFKTAANDLLLGYSLIRWQGGFEEKWLNFLKKQYISSSAHQSQEDYRRYIESRQNRINLEEDED